MDPDSAKKRLEDEVNRIITDRLQRKPFITRLEPIISKVKFPSSYNSQFENVSLSLESQERELRLNFLENFNGSRDLQEVTKHEQIQYFNNLQNCLDKDASSRETNGNPKDDCAFKKDVFLRNTIVEAIVLRKFLKRYVSVLTSDGEEFLVKEPDWQLRMGLSFGVGDVIRVFKPKEDSVGKLIQSDPELVCCYHIELEYANQFLEKLRNIKDSSTRLEEFLRWYAVWKFILNQTVKTDDENKRINCCKAILNICDKVASHSQMSTLAEQFWMSFEGTTFLNVVLPEVVDKEPFQSEVPNLVLTFIENVINVIPKYAIILSSILFKLKLPQNPNTMQFMEKFVMSLAVNVHGAKDDPENLQWNQKPLVPTSSELHVIDSYNTDWNNLPKIKVKKGEDSKDTDYRYSSEEEYYHTNFTLLREECFYNLKTAITEYLNKGQFDPKNARMYR